MTTGFVKDVAREVDRRQRRRKLVVFVLWAALIAAAIVYLRCGRGWGLGGSGGGAGSGSGRGSGTGMGSGSAIAPSACTVRVTAAGTTVDGKPASAKGVAAACGRSHHADVVVTGDAREGTWKDVCVALKAAHVAISVHGDAQVCPP